MLSDDEKERIRGQEEFRHAIQQELEEAAEKSKPSSAVERLLSRAVSRAKCNTGFNG